MKIEIHINEDHIRTARHTPIYRNKPYPRQANVLNNAFDDAGIEVEIEAYGGLDGSAKDWKIHHDGTAYIMTASLKYYYGDAIAELADQRTKPAVITLDDETMTADVRRKRYVSYARSLGYKTLSLGGHWE